MYHTQNLHFAGYCPTCGHTMVSRQGEPGFAPATWHCDICAECGPGIIPSMGARWVDVIWSWHARADASVARFFHEVRMGRLSAYGWVRWLAECFGD